MPQNKIYVGNIAYAAKIDELRALFEPYGEIEDIAFAMDKESGKFRGFAIVMMPDSGDAARAIAGVDGHRLRGRRLVVNEAVKKSKLAKQATAPASAGARGVGSGGLDRRVRASSSSRPRRGGRNPRRG